VRDCSRVVQRCLDPLAQRSVKSGFSFGLAGTRWVWARDGAVVILSSGLDVGPVGPRVTPMSFKLE